MTQSEIQSNRFGFNYYYPLLKDDVLNIRESKQFLEVQCRFCKKWFEPSRSQIQNRLRSIRGSNIGKHYIFCSSECKKESKLFYKRKKLTKSQKKKLSLSHIGQLAWNKGIIGKYHHSEETKKKISKSNKQQIPWIKGRNHREDSKEKIRNYAIRRIEEQKLNGMPLIPAIGKSEYHCFQLLENIFSINIERQKRIGGYFVDGYFQNICIEFDEPFHQKQVEKDNSRQKFLEDHYDLIFFRIDESQWACDRNNVISNFGAFLNATR